MKCLNCFYLNIVHNCCCLCSTDSHKYLNVVTKVPGKQILETLSAIDYYATNSLNKSKQIFSSARVWSPTNDIQDGYQLILKPLMMFQILFWCIIYIRSPQIISLILFNQFNYCISPKAKALFHIYKTFLVELTGWLAAMYDWL